ncbi:putative RNA-directed DNA polymerase from transposon BS [Chionoecetes opilio]|uniref:Putative RNA-directed DNA polymerase from transposon BS n=1 Tax=Chionoecetes opilio TaxID=41210 RepID=A0A8J4Y8M3_CHIOP|nr:putative RNA-directed DNA polymerase from transposon BS [Chionoecetes opilio]
MACENMKRVQKGRFNNWRIPHRKANRASRGTRIGGAAINNNDGFSRRHHPTVLTALNGSVAQVTGNCTLSITMDVYFNDILQSYDFLRQEPWNHSLDRGEDTFVVALDIAGAFDRVCHQGITTKLRSLGICGDLLHLLQDYLHERTLRVVVNGHTSSENAIKASVPQGSVLGPLLWNVYFNDILQLIPEAKAYADDCTLTFTSCERTDRHNTVIRINRALQSIASWGKRWQVTFAPDKTQAVLISRRQDAVNWDQHAILLAGRKIHLQESVNILGGVGTLYKSQVRSLMEYSPLAWSSCPPSYLRLLDRAQARAQRLARLKAPEAAAQIIQPLQQRRDVAGMCVMYKAHRMQLLQLAELRLNPRARPSHSTRAAHNIDHQVTVPFARTEHYLRSFLPRYGRLWNTLVRQTDLHLTTSMHAFKSDVFTGHTVVCFSQLPLLIHKNQTSSKFVLKFNLKFTVMTTTTTTHRLNNAHLSPLSGNASLLSHNSHIGAMEFLDSLFARFSAASLGLKASSPSQFFFGLIVQLLSGRKAVGSLDGMGSEPHFTTCARLQAPIRAS